MIDFSVEEEQTLVGACLKVIGVGGGGGNAIHAMAQGTDMANIEFMVANTDAQALALSQVGRKIQLGDKITKGLGAGSNPDVGRRAAEEDLDAIIQSIQGADILFLTAGMGGGTGSGATSVIAQAAREMGILTVAVVTKPFMFEGKRRMRHAEEAIDQLKQSVDTLLVVPNQKLLDLVDPKISMLDAFALSNDILKQAIKGISDIITRPGHINVDFADVRSIMRDMGMALMGVGRVSGENRAKEAANQAISSPLLEDVNIEGARGVLINITGNTDLGLHEIHEAASVIYDLVSEDANIILGSVIDPEMGDDLMVTVIATGFEARHQNAPLGQYAQQQGTLNQPQGYGFTRPASAQVAHATRNVAPAYGFERRQPSATVQQVRNSSPVRSNQQDARPSGNNARVSGAESNNNHERNSDSSGRLPANSNRIPGAHHGAEPAQGPENNRVSATTQVQDDSFNMKDLDTPAFLRNKKRD